MTRRFAALPLAALAAVLLATACGDDPAPAPNSTTAAGAQPYAGWESRPIAALAPEQVEDLLAGRGAGYALAAELNHYPGPTHVLELSDEIALSEGQESAVREVFTAMQGEARALGGELVALEAELDEAFAMSAIDPARLRELTAAVAGVEGALRNVHLAAHLDVTAILTADQVARYDELRGYTGGVEHDPATHGTH